jgi:hypothetical protein
MDARIRLRYETSDEELAAAIHAWSDYIGAETLSLAVTRGLAEGESRALEVAGSELRVQVESA